MSYAPESIRPCRSASTPAWILCRNLDQLPIPHDEGLLRWTRLGRVRPGDYIVSMRRDQCMQACDVAELDAIFRTATARRLEIAARALVAGGLALILIAPWVAALVLFSAVGAGVTSIGAGCPRRTKYRFELGTNDART